LPRYAPPSDAKRRVTLSPRHLVSPGPPAQHTPAAACAAVACPTIALRWSHRQMPAAAGCTATRLFAYASAPHRSAPSSLPPQTHNKTAVHSLLDQSVPNRIFSSPFDAERRRHRLTLITPSLSDAKHQRRVVSFPYPLSLAPCVTLSGL
jgi:hypothetical protein